MPAGATVLWIIGILIFSIGMPAMACHEWEREARERERAAKGRYSRR